MAWAEEILFVSLPLHYASQMSANRGKGDQCPAFFTDHDCRLAAKIEEFSATRRNIRFPETDLAPIFVCLFWRQVFVYRVKRGSRSRRCDAAKAGNQKFPPAADVHKKCSIPLLKIYHLSDITETPKVKGHKL
jgi:hypothetical protein